MHKQLLCNSATHKIFCLLLFRSGSPIVEPNGVVIRKLIAYRTYVIHCWVDVTLCAQNVTWLINSVL